ncbi:MAG: zinc-ribbon domain-containing protein [Candidatus Faecivivens sp.]|nr:zinc-ribbon domain-containing protein [Candidatus Faecivivens sp.]
MSIGMTPAFPWGERVEKPCRKGTIDMGFIDELISSAKTMVDKAGKQTDKVLEISKLKYQSIQLQNELSHLYEQLGVAVYAKMTEEADNGDLLASLADEITEVRAALGVVEDKISEQKSQRTCPDCGAKLPRDASFCSHCGVKLEVAEKPVEEAAEEVSEEETCCCASEAAEEPAEEPAEEAPAEAAEEEKE